jgi:hypothetical protein
MTQDQTGNAWVGNAWGEDGMKHCLPDCPRRTLVCTPAACHVSLASAMVTSSLSHVTSRPSGGRASAMAVAEYPWGTSRQLVESVNAHSATRRVPEHPRTVKVPTSSTCAAPISSIRKPSSAPCSGGTCMCAPRRPRVPSRQAASAGGSRVLATRYAYVCSVSWMTCLGTDGMCGPPVGPAPGTVTVTRRHPGQEVCAPPPPRRDNARDNTARMAAHECVWRRRSFWARETGEGEASHADSEGPWTRQAAACGLGGASSPTTMHESTTV